MKKKPYTAVLNRTFAYIVSQKESGTGNYQGTFSAPPSLLPTTPMKTKVPQEIYAEDVFKPQPWNIFFGEG